MPVESGRDEVGMEVDADVGRVLRLKDMVVEKFDSIAFDLNFHVPQ